MSPSSDCLSVPDPVAARSELDLHVLQVRVTAEFDEMPGLKLTLAQAARLFSIDAASCASVLGVLVERGVLVTNGRAFARTDIVARCAWIRPRSRVLD
jgi:hypothetical protein